MHNFVEKIKNLFKRKKLLYCSFCGRSQGSVEILLKDKKACICNECVDICNEILLEKGYYSSKPCKQAEKSYCCFCNKNINDIEDKSLLIFDNFPSICYECANKLSSYFNNLKTNINSSEEANNN